MVRPVSQEDRTSLSAVGNRASGFGMRRLLLSLAVGLCGVALSLFFFWLLLAREQESAQNQFQLSAEKTRQVLQNEIANRLSVVRMLGRFTPIPVWWNAASSPLSPVCY